MQATLVEQGFPAPRIVWFDDAARLLGRRFFVMERLEGHSMQGGNRFSDIAWSGPRVVARLATVTASTQATLHRLDAASLVARLAELPAGVERWFARLDSGAAPALAGLGHGLDWLVAHRPVAAGRECICHGDLWGGNILVSGNRVTGVLDYTLATVAEPALDVGFTSMSLLLAPIDVPDRSSESSHGSRLASATGTCGRTSTRRAPTSRTCATTKHFVARPSWSVSSSTAPPPRRAGPSTSPDPRGTPSPTT